MQQYPPFLIKLMESLKKLPGVGSKSAERYAFHFLTWKEKELTQLGALLSELPSQLKICNECGSLLNDDACLMCSSVRTQHILCVVASLRDVFSVESTREYKGLYHVLGGVLSPIDGINVDRLNIRKLQERIAKKNIREVVIALDATIEGDATALYLKKILSDQPVTVSRLAFGIPMGSSLDYVDGGTLARAFSGRAQF